MNTVVFSKLMKFCSHCFHKARSLVVLHQQPFFRKSTFVPNTDWRTAIAQQRKLEQISILDLLELCPFPAPQHRAKGWVTIPWMGVICKDFCLSPASMWQDNSGEIYMQNSQKTHSISNKMMSYNANPVLIQE